MVNLTHRLVNLYEPVARACCRSCHLPEDHVEDIAQDVFLAACRSLSSYGEQVKLSRLLRTIAQHLIVDRLRKQAARRRRARVNHDHELFVSPQNPVQLVQTQELQQKLHASLAALPVPWMKAVKLYYWHHNTAREIAVQMQVKPGTVQVILHRRRQLLRRELAGVCREAGASAGSRWPGRRIRGSKSAASR